MTIGDSSQTGNITFTTATPATTAGASTVVVQDPAGPGQIILDDGNGSGTGLNGNGGTVALTPGMGGIVAPISTAGVPLATQGFNATGLTLTPTLNFAPALGTQLTIINNTATPAASNPIIGTFSNLPQGGTISASYGGTPYFFQANYAGGDGNDLVLTAAKATPTIGSVVVAEATAPKNGILESNETLKITWAASSQHGIASQAVKVDGKAITPTIGGPYGGLYYACTIGTWAAGSHSYTIKLTDSKGVSSNSTGTFTVVAPVPPTIASVVVAEAGTTKNAKLESNETLEITWVASSQHGIASQVVKVDGKAITPKIGGPYGSLYYSSRHWKMGGREPHLHDQVDRFEGRQFHQFGDVHRGSQPRPDNQRRGGGNGEGANNVERTGF